MKFISIDKGDGNKFDELIKERPSFVKFYHPMCGHCHNMAHSWNKLRRNKRLTNKDINIIEVHSDEIPNIKSNVARTAEYKGVPFIIEVNKGGESGKEYDGDRSEDDMTNFILNNIVKNKQNGGKKYRKQTKKITRKHNKKHNRKYKLKTIKKHKIKK